MKKKTKNFRNLSNRHNRYEYKTIFNCHNFSIKNLHLKCNIKLKMITAEYFLNVNFYTPLIRINTSKFIYFDTLLRFTKKFKKKIKEQNILNINFIEIFNRTAVFQ